jgi:hypothetical protein
MRALTWFADLERRVGRVAALLTAHRVRAQSIVLIIACWIPYAILASTGSLAESGNRIAGDFVHFYILGSVAVEGRQNALYDETQQFEDVRRLVPSAGDARYPTPYGPQVSLLFAPLALLPYSGAVAVWLTLTALLYGTCVRLVWLTCPHLIGSGLNVALLAAAFPGFFLLIAFGQNSALALLCFTLGYLALKRRHRFLAGLAFGTLVFKPQLGLAMAVVFALTGEWLIIIGALVAGTIQLGSAWLRFSPDVFLAYWRALRNVADMAYVWDWKPFQMQSLGGFFQLLVPSTAVVQILTICTTIVALLFALRVWRSRAPLALRYAVLLLVTALTTPHFRLYDLVIVAPALLIAADWALARPSQRQTPLVKILVYACFLLPLLWPIAVITRVQVSTIALAALTVVLSHCALMPSVPPIAGRTATPE